LFSDLLADRSTAAEVRAFTAQPYLLAQYRQIATRLVRLQTGLGYRTAGYDLLGRTLSGIGYGAAYAVLAWLVIDGRVSPGAAGATVIGIQLGRAALTRLTTALTRMYERSLHAADYAAFLTDAATRTPAPPTRPAPGPPNAIAVDDISFTYPGRDEPAVDHVSLTLRRGEVLALVGENGSGKSTLSLLLAGLYRPDHGTVAWDGVNLAGADPTAVREQVAVVMQTPARWPMTLRQNVIIGRPSRADPDGSALAGVARDSRTDDVVAELPRGWATLLSRQFRWGQDLSGGQWQRVAVARALYRDAPVLICDEPTAALDARAEAAVYDTIRRLGRGRAVVLVTHRMVTTRDADHIAVLHKGRIVEYGTHAELMARDGRYAAMYNLQADAYRTGEPADV
jgi:ABC-type multidrug transport system fused ATPase/permease subunit